jgi:ribonuclease BN (tRNA processing enzyme)
MSASALIDDTVLFDCGSGVVKRLKADEEDLKKISVVVISHFHADHDFDMPPIIFAQSMKGMEGAEPLTVIAPKGARKRYKKLMKLAVVDFVPKEYKVIEIGKKQFGKPIEINGYVITPYEMRHGLIHPLQATGYTIEKGGKVAAFTGDTIAGEWVDGLLQTKPDIAFLDCTGTKHLNRKPETWHHMDIPDFQDYVKRYPNVKIVPTHMRDDEWQDTVGELRELGIEVPSDKKEYKL